MSDISNLSKAFHDWLSKCPCYYYKKYGQDVYEFYELDEDKELLKE